MQDLEIVVVNFGTNAPIYTEAVFPDPEVRSLVVEEEEKARQRRHVARRHHRNERHNAATTSRTSTRTTRISTTASRSASITVSSRASNRASNTASTSGQSTQIEAINSDSHSDSDSGNATQDSATEQQENSRENSEEEWIMCSIPRNSNEEVQISVHSQQQNRPPAPTRQLLTVPAPNQRRRGARRFRWFGRNVPMANQNRYHPDEDIEECWLSPEPSPNPSPIHSPTVQRIAKKWRRKSLPFLEGCNTCRGDMAIHSHQRPRLTQGLFQVVPNT